MNAGRLPWRKATFGDKGYRYLDQETGRKRALRPRHPPIAQLAGLRPYSTVNVKENGIANRLDNSTREPNLRPLRQLPLKGVLFS
jgi:hypothetical protein